MEQNAVKIHWKIAMLPRLQIDALISVFLLTQFGESHFPGIKDPEYIFWINIPQDKNVEALKREGYILLDIGGGIFDHHAQSNNENEKCMSQMVAEYLGIHKNPSIKKLLEYARRDDLEGKGTISKDPIDRAFGLSGLINNLNRSFPDNQEAILRTVMPLFAAHYIEEKKRAEDFPREYEEKLKNNKAALFAIETFRGPIKLVSIETDEIGIAGYLRAQRQIDIVVQKMSSGHVNIITQQKKLFDLSEIAKFLRVAEAEENGNSSAIIDFELTAPGRLRGVDEWYFDSRARTIQNGGIRPQWTKPTSLPLEAIVEIIKQAVIIKL
jgi:hypothetical protein